MWDIVSALQVDIANSVKEVSFCTKAGEGYEPTPVTHFLEVAESGENAVGLVVEDSGGCST